MSKTLLKKTAMTKAEIGKKLAAFGVKLPSDASKAQMAKALAEAQSNGSNPGHSVHKGPQPGDRI